MAKLVEVVIRWFSRRIGLHTDVMKMYNSVKLVEEDWCYQMYLWQETLDPDVEPEDQTIKTLIYGVKPSGNQAEVGLRETARLRKEEYPRVYEIATEEIYVDDCLSGEDSIEDAYQTADQMQLVFSETGYHLKNFTFSGKPPPKDLSRDGQSINVTGFKWFSEDDTIQLDVGELNFASKQRGRFPDTIDAKRVPQILTRKHCHSQVARIYDITGLLTPITASMKEDLHDLVDRGIPWKDQIPDNLRHVWTDHFEMIKEIPTLRYSRTIIPEDAVSLDIDTIDTGDASKSIACIAIYARLKRRNGEYSCQLVFGRSKLIENGTTQPRAELIAVMHNAHTGEVVRRAFGKYHKSAIKLSDSQIVLHWLNNDQKALKQWVRTRVIESLRFTLPSQWFFVISEDMVADIGTRRGAKLSDVNSSSEWINGYKWMHKDSSTFPMTAVSDLCLSESENESYRKELFTPYQRENHLSFFEMPQAFLCAPGSLAFSNNRFDKNEIAERYEYSQYLVDPNKHSFSRVVRLVALLKLFVKKCRTAVELKRKGLDIERCKTLPQPVDVTLNDEEIREAENYFFRKTTAELRHFAKPSEYEKISSEKEGILYYTGRILPTQFVDGVVTLTDAMIDLSSSTFCVPVIDAHSPVAYSIVNDVHWNHEVANHRGVETVYRHVLQKCFIINGRNLVKLFRKNCERCRYLAKRTIDIEMGAVSSQNLTIAPAFYITQVDIAGPFLAYSPHNKRTTIKIYFVIYCCSTTSSVSIKVMEDYSASSFIQSFIRFSSDNGYPKILVSDEGSQLVKGYDDMRISFTDLKNRLHADARVEYEVVPIGGHNMTGKVERVIKEVKLSIEKSYQKEKLSILQWETVAAGIANTINDMPLALGNTVSDFEEMDLLTPNRLRLGRNNNRSPVGPLYVTDDPSRFFEANEAIFNTWFQTWLVSHVPKLMSQPKWFSSQYHLKEGDIVLFLKKEGLLNTTYQYGMVKSVETGRDGKVRTVMVKYRNHNETFDRETRRAVRQLVMIHQVDELDILVELGNIATVADMKRKLNECNC